jgi:hypothetical protein
MNYFKPRPTIQNDFIAYFMVNYKIVLYSLYCHDIATV